MGLGRGGTARGTRGGFRPFQSDHGWFAAESAQGAESLVLHPGDMVPSTKYRVVKRLGTGGMGVVYEAVHILTERRAALKIMRREVSRSAEALDRFRQEARVASQIGSDAIVQALDFTELPGGRWMYAMELVDGEPVDFDLVDGPLPPERVVAIVRQVARALAAAHDAGIVHRDIKPENIMLERDGERRDRVRLLDFGVAEIASTLREAQTAPVGTPYYIAPETIMGEPSDARVDQYSLGCAGFEMLTGLPPYPEASVADALRCHVESPVPELVDVPDALADVIRRCLAKNPAERYEDMRDFEAALLEAQIACHIVTEWDHLPPPEVDPDRRVALVEALSDPAPPAGPRWRTWSVAAAGVLALGIATAFFVGGEGDETSETPTAAASETDVSTPAEDASAVEAATRAAREAASLGRYVYPPLVDPKATTAFREVVKLEARGTPHALERAAELRIEFAGQLNATADHYYALAPDSPLVAEYYGQVLMFSPDDIRALRRSGLGARQVAALSDQASDGQFDAQRLAQTEPMAILMEPDPERRAVRAAAYEEAVAALPEGPEGPKYAAAFDALLIVRSPAMAAADDAALAQAPEGGEAGADAGSIPPGDGADAVDAGPTAAGGGKREANRLTEKGQQMLRRGKSRQAKDLFESALELNPRLSAAHDGLAAYYFDRSNFSRAATYGKKAVAYSPGNLDYRMQLGDALFKLGRLEEALKHYQRAADGGRADAKRRVDKVRAKL